MTDIRVHWGISLANRGGVFGLTDVDEVLALLRLPLRLE